MVPPAFPLKPGWVNGTLVKSSVPASQQFGKIVMFVDIGAPYQKYLLTAVEAGASGIVVYRDRTDVPGQGMYFPHVHFDESKLVVPVVEVYEEFKKPGSLHSSFPASGSLAVSIWPQENAWKKANDASAFQLTWNVLLSAMQVAIIAIGLLRLRLWASSETGLFAIGPTCIILECISSVLRCVATFVDPFMSFRVLPSPYAETFITASYPFQFTSGILLSFYWTETLLHNKIQATPFISEYKKSSITAIIVLFVCEIATSATRTAVVHTAFNPIYFSQALYVIVSAALTIAYIVCAVQIYRRLSASNAPKRSLRNLTLRFMLSTGGYIMFIILVILLIPYLGYPWGWKILLNLMFLSSNFTGLLQVYSFVPPNTNTSNSRSSKDLVLNTENNSQKIV